MRLPFGRRDRTPLLVVLGLLVVSAAAMPAGTQVPVEGFFDETFGDFSEELERAREAGKRGILIMFEMDECPFCHRMKKTVLNRSDVQSYFEEHFLVFTIDIEGDVEITDFDGRAMSMKDFAFRYNRVRATPVFAFFGLDGKPIKRARYTGATRDAAEFLLLGRFVVEGEFRRQSFTRYKRSARSGS